MGIKKHIPNAITCGNLMCGCLAIIKISEGNLVMAAYLVGIALVLDFFDGFTARLLKVTSPIGKDLDSLADMVTFGVVPGMVMFYMAVASYFNLGVGAPLSELSNHHVLSHNSSIENMLPYFTLIIPIFSAIRLAKFNNDSRQAESFIGLPTPANAIVICSLFLSNILADLGAEYLVIISSVMSFLLVSPIPLFALKFKQFGWKGNEIRYVFLVLAVLCLVIFQFLGLAIAIVLYLVLSLINNLFFKPKVS